MSVRSISLCLLLCCCAVPASADNQVNLYGHITRKDDFVMGKVQAVLGQNVVVSLGFNHGLIEANQLMVLRVIRDSYEVIDFLDVTRVKRDTSLARSSGEVQIQENDLVLLYARDLSLWLDTRGYDDIRIVRSKVFESRKNSYDTRNYRVDGKAVQREIKAKEKIRGDYWKTYIKNRKAAPNLQKKHTSEVAPKKSYGAGQPNIQIPTEGEWLEEAVKLTRERGLYVIPSSRKVGLRIPEGQEGMTPILDKLRQAWANQP